MIFTLKLVYCFSSCQFLWPLNECLCQCFRHRPTTVVVIYPSSSHRANPIHNVHTTRVQPWHQPQGLAESQQTSFRTSDSQRSEAIPIHSFHTTKAGLWH